MTATATTLAAARPAAPAALRLSGVEAAPGGARVLHGVDLVVPAGATTVLVGPSGVGKTTLLRVVSGLERAVAGRVEVGGRDVTTAAPHRRRLGVVFQEPRLLGHRSVGGNVALGLGTGRVTADERAARVEQLLAAVGLAGLGDRAVGGLSGGEQQRVNLARALAPDPRVLLMDEPLAAVDPARRAALRSLVARLTTDRTVLHVTHDLTEAAELGDRLAVLLDGRIVQEGTPRDVLEHPATAAVAALVGADVLLGGVVRRGRFHLGDGGPAVATVGGADGPAALAVRPEHVVLDDTGPLRGQVVASTYRGDHARVTLVLDDDQQVAAHVAVDDAPAVGTSVGATLRHHHRLPTTEAP